MLRSSKALKGYFILARDGEIGRLNDFFFDDDYWIMRYIVVDTGAWIFGKEVLLSLTVLGNPDWRSKSIPVDLTREQVKNSPKVDTAKPVSRQQEIELHDYYQWPMYWNQTSTYGSPVFYPPMRFQVRKAEPVKGSGGDPHLRSLREVIDYQVHARDGEVGHLEDLIVDDDSWTIRYMVIDTGNWLPGRKILLAPHWIEWIDFNESVVSVDLQKKTIEKSPEYDPGRAVNREYEEVLYDYYGRPKYWHPVEMEQNQKED